jgi:hypothetical protein
VSDGGLLQRIQALQFADTDQAEALLRAFIADTFALAVQRVELRPLAVSLNSFNGFLWLEDGRRLFFKTHTEPDNVIGEYYNAGTLAAAGYPVIQPVYASTEAGRQFLIYEVVEWPSVFDVAWAVENGDSTQADTLSQAQRQADGHLLDIYLKTLRWQDADAAASAPIHQLFYHRLAQGRLERFYGPLPGCSGADSPQVELPGGPRTLREARSVMWEINGQRYDTTLDALIADALAVLEPAQPGPSVIGHGDAHNGNVFLNNDAPALIYFDPAFAGRHDPLLDLAKPLFHNVFAMWMYFPQEKAAQISVTFRAEPGRWQVEYDYPLHPVRHLFLESKAQTVLVPLLRELKGRGWLRAGWRRFLKAALFCCPLLTMNLADSRRFPPAISLLGLAMAVEMGADSAGARSLIDRTLDAVQARLDT